MIHDSKHALKWEISCGQHNWRHQAITYTNIDIKGVLWHSHMSNFPGNSHHDINLEDNFENNIIKITVESPGDNELIHYRKTSNISHTLVCNKLVDHSGVVGASPVGAAPTTSSNLTYHLASMDWVKTIARWDEKHLNFEIWCDFYKRFYGRSWY